MRTLPIKPVWLTLNIQSTGADLSCPLLEKITAFRPNSLKTRDFLAIDEVRRIADNGIDAENQYEERIYALEYVNQHKKRCMVIPLSCTKGKVDAEEHPKVFNSLIVDLVSSL